MNDPIQAAEKALKAYQAAYDQLTDGKSVQALLNLLAKIEANSPNGITAKITRKQILKTRQKQRPDLPTPLSLKDDFVRRVVRTLEATDFEQVLRERIEDLERDLEYAKAPKNLHEKMLCLLDTGIDKNTVGSVVCSFFDGIREVRTSAASRNRTLHCSAARKMSRACPASTVATDNPFW